MLPVAGRWQEVVDHGATSCLLLGKTALPMQEDNVTIAHTAQRHVLLPPAYTVTGLAHHRNNAQECLAQLNTEAQR